MRVKNPILLPGKELWSIHFDPLACGRMPSSLRKSELQPLFDQANKRGWIDQKSAYNLLEECCVNKLDSSWALAKSWLARLNPKEERDSQALGAWMTLYNLYKYKNIVKALKPPYQGLRTNEPWYLKSTLKRAIEVELIENPNSREAYRHFLGILLCDLCSQNQDWKLNTAEPLEAIGLEYITLIKELYGKEFYSQNSNTQVQTLWILTPSHGFMKEQRWIQPSIENITEKIKELYKSFNFYKDIELRKIKSSLDKMPH